MQPSACKDALRGGGVVHNSITDTVKEVANEPSVVLYFVQQHVHKAVPRLLALKGYKLARFLKCPTCMEQKRPEMGSSARWKSREAAAVALEEPISSLYEQMREWEPPVEALLAQSCVLLSVDCAKAQVLNRACFGTPIYPATSPQGCASSTSTRSPWFAEGDEEAESAGLFQLGLEEAFFLASYFRCILICTQTSEYQGREALSTEEAWRRMQAIRPELGHLYRAYAHLRAKHWVVRAGIQFGADFMAYRHHPALVHSDYAVVVVVEGQEERLRTWTEMQAMNRLCGSVAKTLLVLHVIAKCEGAATSSAAWEGEFAVEAVEVRRWLPEKNREESDEPGAE